MIKIEQLNENLNLSHDIITKEIEQPKKVLNQIV